MAPAAPALFRDVRIPALFVVLWSTGFIGARLGLPHAGPLTFLALRYGLAAGLLVLVAIATRAPWPRRPAEIGHYAVAGLLVHGIYLGGVFIGISLGVEAGVSALIVGLQPLLTAALAGVLLGERVTPRQWAGLALGLSGVALILARKLGQGPGDTLGSLACVAALLGITAGTLYQKRYCARMDLRTGSVVQFAAAGAATAPLALLFEDTHIDWNGEFVFALFWLVVVLSLGAVSLLYLLIRRGAAAQVASLFFLVPPCTALIAWPLFGETLGPAAIAGMGLTALGVAMASRGPKRSDRDPGDW
ncbi:MAG: DMT family transporter [Sphingomonas sp.]|uniref:DMT family transporter n=1 Tax=Sphingomonas sp. TaxID=28214 RepID=UPI0022728DAE|nr:DMT family transporter [Sphingomonas sp.]MCX8477131.1 DMT family transporter [Sphingomonas sp.]